MSSEPLFRDDPYGTTFSATVVAADADGIVLDRTLFYPRGGGQPGDPGTLQRADGTPLAIADTVYDDAGDIRHRPASDDAALPARGEAVQGTLDWSVRYPRMRIHTALHLLSVVIPAPVTGGSIGEGQGRLDFDLPESGLDRDTVTAGLQALVAADHAVTTEWISEAELDARPELVKTLSVKPPRTGGPVRLVRIGDVDLQPCGGTHVASTAEIGAVRVRKIEKKSRHNRRVSIVIDD